MGWFWFVLGIALGISIAYVEVREMLKKKIKRLYESNEIKMLDANNDEYDVESLIKKMFGK